MAWLPPRALRRIGDLTPAQFLRDYWQQRPLFIRGAVPELAGLLDGNDLAGLALEEQVESRIVARDGKGQWSLRRGPFSEQDFARLPGRDWTLLVQAVDHYLPELAELLERFSFLPHWRMDDVMVSYAVDGGGVGPHYDNYDVFLIQGSGKRLWRVGPAVGDGDLLPHPDLRILRDMPVEQEFLCEPGDLLYLPPRLAHWGIAQGECMTWSVGFRAPSDRELLDGFCNYLVERTPEQQRYGDAGARATTHPGALSPAAIDAFRQRLDNLLQEPGALEDFLGGWLSEPKYAHQQAEPAGRRWTPDALRKALSTAAVVRREEGSRFLFVPALFEPSLYLDGARLRLPEGSRAVEAAVLVADHRLLDPRRVLDLLEDPAACEFLLGLFQSGHLYLPENPA